MQAPQGADVLSLVETSLDDDKAILPVTLDLRGKTTIADFMVIATGTSQRHISSMADKLVTRLKAEEIGNVTLEGGDDADWVLIDAGDVIVHLFRDEARGFYNLEKLWGDAELERAPIAANA
ncbi:ribosome silencing factor [Marinivivus vitaminiproducens]|uniref:ribosome silencing factor n=1 Tax=Marinivivus vitaminiproducens TaxID=3035935 RepID=UPI00279F25D7|nr:ribosome silencing factor [Geminicoccaceae bacterium SCSIO 64248]